ncbi:SDR family NAD(P)-dependent oxidoreductase, partial [Hymenobacter terrenus]|uniref:SDR family NAD(P)-dependent oxidoreductase n=1 Tax=Hymenobacter terrenus TaxID=1629124 RepID=UPI0006194EC1
MNCLPLFDLTNKYAVITGCSRGIGQAMPDTGAHNIGVSTPLALEEIDTAQQVGALGRRFYAYQADFSLRDQVDAFTTQVLLRFPRIDILVNNAGTIRRAPVAEHPNADWDDVLAINLKAPSRLARPIGGQMLKQGSGKIIFTTLLLTFQGEINVPGYAASKGA